MQTNIATDALVKLINEGNGTYPKMRDGFMREDVRNVFVESVANGEVKDTGAFELVLDREWNNFSHSQKNQLFDTLIGEHYKKAWVSDFLIERGEYRELDYSFRRWHPREPRKIEDELKYLGLWANVVKGDPALLTYVLSVCPREYEQLSVSAGALDNLADADVLPIVATLCAFSGVRETNPAAYDALVSLYTCVFIEKRLEHFVPELRHSGAHIDVVTVLAAIAREHEDYWPVILRLAAKLRGVDYKGTAQVKVFSQAGIIEWKPEWIDGDLGASLANAFLGWMEKKKNRNARELFSTDFTATLASLPNLADIVPDAISRLFQIWTRNIVPHSSGCADALVPIWSALSDAQKDGSIENILRLASEVEGERNQSTERAKLDELLNVVRSISKYEDPSVYTRVLPALDAVLSLPGVSLFSRHAKTLVPMTKNPLGAHAVAQWVQNAMRETLFGPGALRQGANTAQLWMNQLAEAASAPIVQIINDEGRLPELVADMALSFLHDPLFSYHPYRNALENFTEFQHRLGATDFAQNLDAALERDIGKHAFASLLSTLAPETGPAVWSTIESMYHDDILEGSLLLKPEVIDLIRDAIASAIRKNPPQPPLELPAF